MINDNKAICVMPFIHIFGNSTGNYHLCCHTTKTSCFSKEWNFKDDLPFDYFNSDDMKSIRKDMINGVEVADCNVCYDKEKNGIKSQRQSYNEKFDLNAIFDPYGSYRFIELKISIHGNWCNLSCAMCAPAHSTERTKEIKNSSELQELGPWLFTGKNYKINSKRFSEIVDNIIENIDRVENIQFSTDGEPLQNPRFWNLLQRIPDDHAKEISISVTTNLSKVGLDKERSIQFIVEKFKYLGIRVSCEHFGEKYDWIRWKGNYKNLEDNLVKYKHIIRRISPAINILNVEDILEIDNYYKLLLKRNLFGQSYSYVKNPKFLNPALHKDCERLAEKFLTLPKWKNLGKQMLHDRKNLDIEKLREQMNRYMESLSKHRGDWKELWHDI